MVVSHRSIALAGAFVILNTLLASCGESKVVQCNKLIGLTNQVTDEIMGLQQGGGKSIDENKKQLEKIANSLDSYSKKAEAISLQDEQLKALQKQIIAMYQQTRDSSRALLTAANLKDMKATDAAMVKLRRDGKTEESVLREVNAYCSPANANPSASTPAAAPTPASPQPAK